MREDPYYPPQDPRWPAFEQFMIEYQEWRKGWSWHDNFKYWWPHWQAFVAGYACQGQFVLELWCVEEGSWGPSCAAPIPHGWRPVTYNEYGAVLLYAREEHARGRMSQLLKEWEDRWGKGHLPGPLYRVAKYVRAVDDAAK